MCKTNLIHPYEVTVKTEHPMFSQITSCYIQGSSYYEKLNSSSNTWGNNFINKRQEKETRHVVHVKQNDTVGPQGHGQGHNNVMSYKKCLTQGKCTPDMGAVSCTGESYRPGLMFVDRLMDLKINAPNCTTRQHKNWCVYLLKLSILEIKCWILIWNVLTFALSKFCATSCISLE